MISTALAGEVYYGGGFNSETIAEGPSAGGAQGEGAGPERAAPADPGGGGVQRRQPRPGRPGGGVGPGASAGPVRHAHETAGLLRLRGQHGADDADELRLPRHARRVQGQAGLPPV